MVDEAVNVTLVPLQAGFVLATIATPAGGPPPVPPFKATTGALGLSQLDPVVQETHYVVVAFKIGVVKFAPVWIDAPPNCDWYQLSVPPGHPEADKVTDPEPQNDAPVVLGIAEPPLTIR